jgi:formiminotetrahydrofolate cyclodeaminase
MTDFAAEPLGRFLEELASQAPTPGGGTAAAVCGAMGAALAEMVAGLTLAKEKFADVHPAMRSIADRARAMRTEMIGLAGEDAAAYDAVVAARKLPKDSDEQKADRARALAAANRLATEVPMRTARAAVRLLATVPELAEKANPSAASDAGTAALLLEAAASAALLNVGINLPGVKDPAFLGEMTTETAQLTEESQRLRAKVLELAHKKF